MEAAFELAGRSTMIERCKEGRVLIATLNRPPVNALDAEMATELRGVVAEACDDPSTSALLIRSNQGVFSAGGDLKYLQERMVTEHGPAQIVDNLLRPLHRALDDLEQSEVITIAEIGGHALGGGLELALACDLRIASKSAKLGLVEVHLGLIAGAGGTQRLTQLCGRGVASRLLLTGEAVNGSEAERLGLVQWAMEADQLSAFAMSLATKCSALPSQAIAAAKRCIGAAGRRADDGFALEIESSKALYADRSTRSLIEKFISRGNV